MVIPVASAADMLNGNTADVGINRVLRRKIWRFGGTGNIGITRSVHGPYWGYWNVCWLAGKMTFSSGNIPLWQTNITCLSFQPVVHEFPVPCGFLAGTIAATAGFARAPESVNRGRRRFACGHSGA